MFALEAVTHHYGALTALDGVSVAFPTGSVTAIVGSSGCGKSTLLRLLLGLERSTRGRVLFQGRPVNERGWCAVRHASGYVIQGGGLFPHLDGERNLALLPRHLGWTRVRLRERIQALCETVDFDPRLLRRYPQELSGGQRQRLALLRALMIDPPALLLDEPLSALDPISRHHLQDELRALIERLHKTVLLVTHDLAEAAFLAPRLILMQAGRIVQDGSLEGLRNAPANDFVREFLAAQRTLPMRRKLAWLVPVVLWPIVAHSAAPLVIGSKNFTESVILGEVVRLQAVSHGMVIEHRRALGGSTILWQALLNGRIDAYPEYTGTLTHELLHDLPESADLQSLTVRLAALGIGIGPSLGFEDGYALVLSAEGARRLHMMRLSDLSRRPGLRFGLSNEFLNRADGWPRLRQTFAPPEAQVRGLDHDLAYRALAAGDIDVIDCYTTDAEIAFYHLQPLSDDRGFFPRYEAHMLYRLDALRRDPRLAVVLEGLANRISAPAMRALNAQVKLEGRGETQVAATFLHLQAPAADDWLTRLQRRTVEHLALVGLSMALAIALGIPLGVLAAHWAGAKQAVLAVTSILQTVPSLAMLVFLIPWLGIGAKPAIAALFFYSLLPIVRNTIAGLDGIERDLLQAARGLGLPGALVLLRVELPLALPTIIAGISTAAVINVGTATLGALIGAGGYGQPILTGVRLDDTRLILEGAIPAALLALLAQAAFQLLGHLLTPRGLRRRRAPQPAAA